MPPVGSAGLGRFGDGLGKPTEGGRVSGQHLGQVAGELGTEFLHAGNLLFV